MLELMSKGLYETLYMVIISTALSYVIGLPLGVFLVMTDKNGIRPMPKLYMFLGFIINALRSIPFLILLVALLPFTELIIGTTLGSKATIVPLVIGSAPFIARLVESSLQEVDSGVIEAALSMGASNKDIIFKVLLPEARPSLIVGSAIAVATILGYSAMAGFCGGGGLGAIAINYGYYRYQWNVMFVTIIILVLVVQILQEVAMKLAKLWDKRK